MSCWLLGMDSKRYNKGYEDLQVWQQSVDLAVLVYQITKLFPAEEKYGLISQMRRCAYSVASNIAEGCSRDGNAEFLHFLSISKGSLAELKTQAIIAQRVELFEMTIYSNLLSQIDVVGRMISGLQASLRKNSTSNQQLTTSN